MVAPKGMFPAKSLVPVMQTHLEPGSLQCGYPPGSSGWALNLTSVLIKGTQRSHVKMGTEIGGTQPHPRGGNSHRWGLCPFPGAFRESVTLQSLDFGLLASRAVKEQVSVALDHLREADTGN